MSVNIDIDDVGGLEKRLEQIETRQRWLQMALFGKFREALEEELQEEAHYLDELSLTDTKKADTLLLIVKPHGDKRQKENTLVRIREFVDYGSYVLTLSHTRVNVIVELAPGPK